MDGRVKAPTCGENYRGNHESDQHHLTHHGTVAFSSRAWEKLDLAGGVAVQTLARVEEEDLFR